VLRLGVGERGVTEIMAVAEHVAGMTAAAAGFQLGSQLSGGLEVRSRSAPRPTEQSNSDETLAEIRAWHRDTLGIDAVPDFWLLLAQMPRLCSAVWRKDLLVMGTGKLDAPDKACIALAVAMFRASPYCISYYTELVRRLAGLDDRGLVELTGCVMHYVNFNTVAHGMLLTPPYTGLTAADLEGG
jgi:alkylhydroperoxidase/carboxymuconolactone decarboxylase family protein YurZ